MATRSMSQNTLSRRSFVSAAAALPVAAALSPILPAKAEPPSVDGWRVYRTHWVLDGAGEVVAFAFDPDLAQAIAQGGGYTLPKPTGPMGDTMVTWDDAARRQMATASEWEPESWPAQVDTFARWTEGVEPHCESSIFDSDAQRRDAVITTVCEWALAPQHARLDAALDALGGQLVKGSIEERLLRQVDNMAMALYVRAIEVAIAATDAMGAEGVPDVEPKQLTAMARELSARM